MEDKKIMYAYIKGGRYTAYSVLYDGDEELNEIKKTFHTLEELQDFVINFSNYYSISIQYYY